LGEAEEAEAFSGEEEGTGFTKVKFSPNVNDKNYEVNEI
jgi:hypothetical protein